MEELNKTEVKENIKNTKKTIKEEKKNRKKIKKQLRKVSADKEEIVEIRKKRYIIETIIIVVLAIFMLILLCNRTFFREEYKTNKINIDIPLLTFFISDDGNEIVLKTLRKSEYLKEYFDLYLSNLARYNCDTTGFYYDNSTRTAIYDITIEKDFAIKTIKIKYTNGDANQLCDVTNNYSE